MARWCACALALVACGAGGAPLSLPTAPSAGSSVAASPCVVVKENQQKRSTLISRVIMTYDARGRILREVSDMEDARYAYDASGREVHEQRFRPDEEVAYVDYVTTHDASGRPLLQQGHDPNGVLRNTWTYDERGREVEREMYRDGSLLLRTRVSYDSSGRRVGEEHTNDKGDIVGRESWTYDSFGDEASHRTESFESKGWVEERYSYTASMKCRP